MSQSSTCCDPPTKPVAGGKPAWLRRKLPTGPQYEQVRRLLAEGRLHTVCQKAQCPNMFDCFSSRTATFLIMGDRCTRTCRFCAIENQARPAPLDPDEPRRVAEAAARLQLSYVVVTSVTRDDIKDGGAAHFAAAIRQLRRRIEKVRIEVLIPDLGGSASALNTILDARPDVLNHNIETVARLYPLVRPEADYQRSLQLLERAARSAKPPLIKSGLMLGLGETDPEISQTFDDLMTHGCRLLTLGQYLQPSRRHLPVFRYVPPAEFVQWKKTALARGFSQVASDPFVRSSFEAAKLFQPQTGET